MSSKINIYQGDCLELMPEIADKSIDMILADLPYGITSCKWDTVIPLEPLWKQYKRIIKNNGAIVLTASQPFTSALVMSNPKMFRYDICWHKKTPSGILNAKKMPIRTHESILIFYKNYPIYNYNKILKGKICGIKRHKVSSENYRNTNKYVDYIDDGTRYPTSVLEITGIVNNSKEKLPHPTQKPVKLMEYLIFTYTNENETVLDNVMGSGTTGVACINTNRNFIGIELDKEYFKIAEKRINNHKAQLQLYNE